MLSKQLGKQTFDDGLSSSNFSHQQKSCSRSRHDSIVWFGKNGTNLKAYPALNKYKKEHQEE